MGQKNTYYDWKVTHELSAVLGDLRTYYSAGAGSRACRQAEFSPWLSGWRSASRVRSQVWRERPGRRLQSLASPMKRSRLAWTDRSSGLAQHSERIIRGIVSACNSWLQKQSWLCRRERRAVLSETRLYKTPWQRVADDDPVIDNAPGPSTSCCVQCTVWASNGDGQLRASWSDSTTRHGTYACSRSSAAGWQLVSMLDLWRAVPVTS